MAERLKLIVLDDDPTGSQTVHSCPLLLRWDAETLRRGLAHPSPLLFVLANTRALDPEAARQRVREICQALKPLLAELVGAGPWQRWMVICRGDSTLRGHFPLEAEVVAEELGPFHARLLVPAFLPGGRTTVDGVHLLHGEPVHRSPFARDGLFGYSTSHLPAWVEQKTGGRVPVAAVQQISLAELDEAQEALGLQELVDRLRGLEARPWVVVNAEHPRQLEALGKAIGKLTAEGYRFLAQSAASLINGLIDLPVQPFSPRELSRLTRRNPQGPPKPGLVMVGSYVPLADRQLEQLLREPECISIELSVVAIVNALRSPHGTAVIAEYEQLLKSELKRILSSNCTPVLFTSRGEVACDSIDQRIRLGKMLAELMARIVADFSADLGYVISKGGITTNALLADGLNECQVELQGQLFKGLSVVLASDLPIVTFPGNLGPESLLVNSWRAMSQGN